MNIVQIVAAANDRYVPYLSVMLRSVMDFSSIQRQYNITVLHKDITRENQMTLIQMLSGTNFSIEFINVTERMRDCGDLFVSNHIKIETYFRLLLPELLPDIEKVLYIDCDVIANTDVAELFDYDVKEYFLAGTRDADSAANYNINSDYHKYINEIVGLEQPYDYLQAGIILMNLDKFRLECPTNRLLEVALERNWRFHDQDTLNHLCHKKIMFVDYAWNFVYDYDESYRRSKKHIVFAPHYILSDYLKAKKNPKMIHFSWTNKPWFSPGVHFGEKYWMIARKSPYYTQMFLQMEADLGRYILG